MRQPGGAQFETLITIFTRSLYIKTLAFRGRGRSFGIHKPIQIFVLLSSEFNRKTSSNNLRVWLSCRQILTENYKNHPLPRHQQIDILQNFP
jgi:hypothetical protein